MVAKKWHQWAPAMLAWGGLAAVSPSASAAFASYADEASFLAAAGTVKKETFNGFTNDVSAAGGAFNVGDFVVKNGAWTIDTPPTAIGIDGTANLFFVFSNAGNGAFSELNFAEPIKAFGAWFGGTSAFGTIEVAADSLEGFGSYRNVGSITPAATAGEARFIGFTSDQTFNRIVFLGRSCCFGQISIDNVVYAEVTAVPEPATVALVFAGLVCVAAPRVRSLGKAAA